MRLCCVDTGQVLNWAVHINSENINDSELKWTLSSADLGF